MYVMHGCNLCTDSSVLFLVFFVFFYCTLALMQYGIYKEEAGLHTAFHNSFTRLFTFASALRIYHSINKAFLLVYKIHYSRLVAFNRLSVRINNERLGLRFLHICHNHSLLYKASVVYNILSQQI